MGVKFKFEKFRDFDVMGVKIRPFPLTLHVGLTTVQGYWPVIHNAHVHCTTLPVGRGYKIITYLESQTLNFCINYQTCIKCRFTDINPPDNSRTVIPPDANPQRTITPGRNPLAVGVCQDQQVIKGRLLSSTITVKRFYGGWKLLIFQVHIS